MRGKGPLGAVILAILLSLPILPVGPVEPAGAAGETITVNSPDGGEVLKGGSYYNISWTTSSIEGAIHLTFSTDGGHTFPNEIVVVTNSRRQAYTWLVPNNIDSTSVRMRADWVSSEGSTGTPLATDYSDADLTIETTTIVRFTNAPPAVTAGRFYLLKWQLYDGRQTVKGLDMLMRVKTEGDWGEWKALGGDFDYIQPDDGGVWWTPPLLEDAMVQLRVRAITDMGQRLVASENDTVPITLRSPIVMLTSPNGGETLLTSHRYDVTWKTVTDPHAPIVNMSIHYSLDGGLGWTAITTATANDGTEPWVVPAVADSDLVRVRVSALWGSNQYLDSDESDTDIRIINDANAVSVFLIDPNPWIGGGLVLRGGEQHLLKWSVTGLVSSLTSFKVYFSPDNGTTYEPVIDAAPQMTQIIWSLTAVDTFQAKIRIDAQPFSSPMRRSESINPFYIFTDSIFNRPPIAMTGSGQDVVEGAPVQLSGAQSYDPDGDTLIYSWKQVAPRAFTAQLDDTRAVSPTFRPRIGDSPVDFVFELQVTDGYAHEPPGTDNVSLTSVHVTPLPPTLVSFTPRRVWVGMEVTITGTNLMNAQILIGDVLTGTVPTWLPEGDPDTSYTFIIGADVPHAPNPIVVRTLAGQASTADPIEVYPIPQWPLDWGMPFPNPSKDPLTYPAGFWENGAFKDAFGSDDVYANYWVANGTPTAGAGGGLVYDGYRTTQIIGPDPFATSIYGSAFWFIGQGGECYGMGALSLQLYHEDVLPSELQSGANSVDDLLRKGTVERRVDWLHGSQLSAEALGVLMAARPFDLVPSSEADPPTGMGATLSQVRAAIDDGQLGILAVMAGVEGHSMVPYLVEDVDATRTRIYVYDPDRVWWSSEDPAKAKIADEEDAANNFPPFVEVVKDGEYWEWRFLRSDGTEWGGETGLMFVPYPVVSGAHSLPSAAGGVLSLVAGQAVSSVTDGQGGRIQVTPEGVVTSTIAGASPLPVLMGANADHRGYVLPQGDYTTDIEGTSPGLYNWTATSGGKASYSIDGAPADVGTSDTIAISFSGGDPYLGTVTFKTSDAGKSINMTQVKLFGGAERVYRVRNITSSGGSGLVFNATRDLGALTVRNGGTQSATFDVEFLSNAVVESVWNSTNKPKSMPATGRRGIPVGAGESVTVRPTDWLDLTHAQVLIEGEVIQVPPGVPRDLTATPGYGQVALAWLPPESDGGTAIINYVLMRGPTTTTLVEHKVLGVVTSYLDTEVEANMTYHYALIAVNAKGRGPETETVMATVPYQSTDGDGDGDGGGLGGTTIALIAIVIVVVIVVALVMMRRRRAAPADVEGPDEEEEGEDEAPGPDEGPGEMEEVEEPVTGQPPKPAPPLSPAPPPSPAPTAAPPPRAPTRPATAAPPPPAPKKGP